MGTGGIALWLFSVLVMVLLAMLMADHCERRGWIAQVLGPTSNPDVAAVDDVTCSRHAAVNYCNHYGDNSFK